MEKKGISFEIETEVAPAYFEELLEFIYREYIQPREEHFTNVKRATGDHSYLLSFKVLVPDKKGSIDVEISAEKKIYANVIPSDEKVPHEAVDRLKEDLIVAVQFFEEKIRESTLYFAWVEGQEVTPEKAMERRKNIIYRIFSDSMHLFFLASIAASIIFFIFLGRYAPIVIVALQFALILLSDKFIIKMGDWRITQENPNVHLFQYHLPVEDHEDFKKRYSEERLTKIKSEIYEKTLAKGKAIDCETAEQVLSRHGFQCIPENMSTKTINVYELVKKAARKFGLSVPKIAVANTIVPNAAASGPSPSRGVTLLTTGLLVQLEEDEILNVVGHELSHLKARDPLVLFGLTAGEYLLRFYVFLNLFFVNIFFGYLYLFFALTTVFFVAKFFEGRADLEAAVRIGQPKVLAEALRKIGFSKLQFERSPSYRLQSWIRWDPHPPTYFRVARLDRLEDPEKVGHPLIQSIKDNVRGFVEALG